MNETMKIKIKGLMLAVVIICASYIAIILIQPKNPSITVVGRYDIKNFNSYKELTSFLNYYNMNYKSYAGGVSEGPIRVYLGDSSSASSKESSSTDYSGTNIQVPGVDEPDIVKTDGTYLYVVSHNNVTIIRAYPPENLHIETVINIDSNLSIRNLFINDNRLVIFSESYVYRILETSKFGEENTELVYNPWYNNPETHIYIYDLTDIIKPGLVKEIIIPGSFHDARLIGEYIYVITIQYYYAYDTSDNYTFIPRLMVNKELLDVPLSDIYYADTSEKSNTLTNILSINIMNDDEEIHCKIFLIGTGQNLYVSHRNIYIAYYNYYDYYRMQSVLYDTIESLLPPSILSQIDTVKSLNLEDYQKQEIISWIIQKEINNILTDKEKKQILESIIDQIEYTTIHRISINDGEITYEAQGNVPGYMNNQFSFDEYNNHLRVSTTISGSSLSYYLGSIQPRTNIYVLDMNLQIIGRIEDITPGTGESIYATRFLGDICYLVTFRQTDPFFVIDLSNPYNPTIKGELKIPGYSTYLHPYDENHVIGVGVLNNKIKISLFDVSDKQNPSEITNLSVGGNEWWPYSSALYEHKAFLFSREKNLLVIPVGSWSADAYVFDISIENGIKLKGNISHDTENKEMEYYYDTGIQRSLYIEDVLYTISTKQVKLNNLSDLTEVGCVSL
ncbi:MAG: beta-propeller domain-containing protein [Candidatus Thermoplasmatota archaeon]